MSSPPETLPRPGRGGGGGKVGGGWGEGGGGGGGEEFEGYLREDGRAGTRNYLAVVAASNCAAHTAEQIAASFANESLPANVDGVVAFPHGEGCGHSIGPDTRQLQRTLAGVLDHPNVSAAVILGLGCEVNQIDHYLGPNAPQSKRLVGLTVQGSGGTRGAVEAARREIRKQIEQAAAEKRVSIPASKIDLRRRASAGSPRAQSRRRRKIT
jgi:altronate hydrolase